MNSTAGFYPKTAVLYIFAVTRSNLSDKKYQPCKTMVRLLTGGAIKDNISNIFNDHYTHIKAIFAYVNY